MMDIESLMVDAAFACRQSRRLVSPDAAQQPAADEMRAWMEDAMVDTFGDAFFADDRRLEEVSAIVVLIGELEAATQGDLATAAFGPPSITQKCARRILRQQQQGETL